MSRNRTSRQSAPNKVECLSSGSSVFLTNFYSTASPFESYYWSGSTMTDEVTPHGVDRTFNALTHNKYVAAVFEDPTIKLSYSPPTPSMISVDFQGVCARHTNPPTTGLPALSYDDLVTSLADQLDDRINEGSLALVTLAELGKTIQMVRNPFNLLRPAWRKKFGRTNPASSLIGKASDYWLEWTYGWKAAYADVKAAAKTVARLNATLPTFHQGLSRLSAQKVETSSWAGPLYQSGITESMWESKKASMEGLNLTSSIYYRAKNADVRRYVRLGCRQDLAKIERMNQFSRFLQAWGAGSVSNIVDTLWEVVPYSFVIDWFLDWHAIASVPTLARLGEVDVRHLGSSVKTVVTYEVEILSSPAWYVYYQAGPWQGRRPTSYTGSFITKGKAINTNYSRTPGGPGISTLISGFLGSGLSSCRSISGLSLIVQRLKR